MASPTNINLNADRPPPPPGEINVKWQAGDPRIDPNYPTQLVRDVSAYVPPMTGDTGSGGLGGAVPAPAAGDAAAGKYLKADGTWAAPPGGGGGGTVTSVGLAAPAEFTVSGSPVTGAGTLTLAKANESANTVWAGPSSGSPAAPTFRPIVSADVPASVALTGTPTAPTPSTADNSTKLATTAYVQAALTAGPPPGVNVPLLVGFVLNSAAPGTNVGPMFAAPRAGSLQKCVVVVDKRDPAVNLSFRIRQNGTDIFATDPVVAAGTATGSVLTFASLTSVPLAVAANDVFSIDVITGNSNWSFTAQLEGTAPTSGSGNAPLASPVFTGSPQGPAFWSPCVLSASLVAPADCTAPHVGLLSVPAGLLIDLTAGTGLTCLELL